MSLLTFLTYWILLALADTPVHGYGIVKEVARRAKAEAEPEAGPPYERAAF